MAAALAEMETISSQLHLQQALRSRIFLASQHIFKPGDQANVYKETYPMKWTGPFKIVRIERKQVFMDLLGKEVQYSINHIRPYLPNNTEKADTFLSTLHTLFTSVAHKNTKPNTSQAKTSTANLVKHSN